VLPCQRLHERIVARRGRERAGVLQEGELLPAERELFSHDPGQLLRERELVLDLVVRLLAALLLDLSDGASEIVHVMQRDLVTQIRFKANR